MSSGFASRCESRFFIAELCRFATRLTSQALERQDVWLVRLLQYDVSIAFGEMSFGRNAARGLADGCPAHCERLRRLLFDHRTSKCVSVTIAEFLGDSSIDRQNGLRRRSSMEMIAIFSGDQLFALTAHFGTGCRETWTDANRSRGQKQRPSFGRPQNWRTAYLLSCRAIQRTRLNGLTM
jgi:hypothetical protein